MRAQISKTKKARKLDEEISSDDEEAGLNFDQDKPARENKESAVQPTDDPFFQGDEGENEDERRLRMTKKLIQTVGEESKEKEKQDFFLNLQTNTSAEVDILKEEDDGVRRALKYKLLEQKEKLFYKVADRYGAPDAEYDRIFIKGHKRAITHLEWLPGNRQLMTSSKDCNLIMWDLESQAKLFFKGEKFNRAI
mmetsp:Transcript_19417/g.29828  ORF Transcript_19417/g.29828 Transcript_19417/m.29828 type:complete len:194 (+) Transcript_19417:109-690(+)|eukprot:CAMPEP_0170502248 /NCGR_PEP_ID=MMETSP0208-20121228/40952_1 /TAXON_ID=197538 /ORGANISM="Strombidium inclinatum, Strain S3" /LENGTH=193 /DNA_ID=CAMNT_0010781223 /DNA_START=46 /DNA_END=627 /DNA_ORIENTATION=+